MSSKATTYTTVCSDVVLVLFPHGRRELVTDVLPGVTSINTCFRLLHVHMFVDDLFRHSRHFLDRRGPLVREHDRGTQFSRAPAYVFRSFCICMPAFIHRSIGDVQARRTVRFVFRFHVSCVMFTFCACNTWESNRFILQA